MSPLQFNRMVLFWSAIRLTSRTLEKPVAKWSCQNSTSFSWSGKCDFTMYLIHLLCARSMSAPDGLKPFGVKPSTSSAAAPRWSPFSSRTSFGSAPNPVRRSRCPADASSRKVFSSPIPVSPFDVDAPARRFPAPIRFRARRPRSRA